MKPFNAIKVFSATMMAERLTLGEKVTDWMTAMSAKYPTSDRTAKQTGFEIVDTVVTQSSDSAFHCIVITVFYIVPGLQPKPALDVQLVDNQTAKANAESWPSPPPKRLRFQGDPGSGKTS